jgi:thiol-disulfide isomerase/thioredoxin
MKLLISILFLLHLNGNPGWLTNMDEAKQEAKAKHEFILLNFSGSDWCGPCIRLHDEIFGSDIFKKFADGRLVLVNADFPRLKKNQLPKDQAKRNDALADQYNKTGIFPYTLLLDENGKVLKAWEGFYDGGPGAFTDEIKFAMSFKPS